MKGQWLSLIDAAFSPLASFPTFFVMQMEDYMLWYLVQLFLFQCDLCYLSYGGFINHQSHKSRSHIHLCLFFFSFPVTGTISQVAYLSARCRIPRRVSMYQDLFMASRPLSCWPQHVFRYSRDVFPCYSVTTPAWLLTAGPISLVAFLLAWRFFICMNKISLTCIRDRCHNGS